MSISVLDLKFDDRKGSFLFPFDSLGKEKQEVTVHWTRKVTPFTTVRMRTENYLMNLRSEDPHN